MVDEAVGDFGGEAVVGIAAEEGWAGQPTHEGFDFVVEGGEAADGAAGIQGGSVLEPLANFLAALGGGDDRGATDNGLEWEVVAVPEPTEGKEGKAQASTGGEDDFGLGAGGEEAFVLGHASVGESGGRLVFVRADNAVDVEKEYIQLHSHGRVYLVSRGFGPRGRAAGHLVRWVVNFTRLGRRRSWRGFQARRTWRS